METRASGTTTCIWHYDVHLSIQYPTQAVRRAKTPCLFSDQVSLRTDSGEPSMLIVAGPLVGESRSKSVEDIWHEPSINNGMERFFGDYAEDLVDQLVLLVKDKLQSGVPDDLQYSIRFRDPVDYYCMYFRQCQLIAEGHGTTFDAQNTLATWRAYWMKTEGSTGVPGQRSWYAENGPVGSETQEQYDGDVAAFEQLVADNLTALDVLEQELSAAKV
jgi:hypothetical protein